MIILTVVWITILLKLFREQNISSELYVYPSHNSHTQWIVNRDMFVSTVHLTILGVLLHLLRIGVNLFMLPILASERNVLHIVAVPRWSTKDT